MTLLLGIICLVVGISGAVAALRNGYLRDRSGWIYLRKSRNEALYWMMILVFVSMSVVGAYLIYIASEVWTK